MTTATVAMDSGSGPINDNKPMTDQEIQKDRSDRINACKKTIEAVLSKFQFGITAEDYLTPNVKVNVQIQFVDLKKYDAQIAQPENVKVPVNEANNLVPEGKQADGSVVINPESLK